MMDVDNQTLLLTYEDRDAKIEELQQQLQATQEQRDRYRDRVDGVRQECADMPAETERLRVHSDALQREVDALRNTPEIEQLKQQIAQLRESHDRQTRTTKEAQENAQARFKLMTRAVRQLKHAVEAVAVREITAPMSAGEARDRLEKWLGDDAGRFCRMMSVPQPLDKVPAWLRGLLRSIVNERGRTPAGTSDLGRITWRTQMGAQRKPKPAYLCDQTGTVSAEVECPGAIERAQDVADKTGKWLYLALPISPRPHLKTSRKTHA
jgi:hypothetical protein